MGLNNYATCTPGTSWFVCCIALLLINHSHLNPFLWVSLFRTERISKLSHIDRQGPRWVHKQMVSRIQPRATVRQAKIFTNPKATKGTVHNLLWYISCVREVLCLIYLVFSGKHSATYVSKWENFKLCWPFYKCQLHNHNSCSIFSKLFQTDHCTNNWMDK